MSRGEEGGKVGVRWGGMRALEGGGRGGGAVRTRGMGTDLLQRELCRDERATHRPGPAQTPPLVSGRRGGGGFSQRGDGTEEVLRTVRQVRTDLVHSGLATADDFFFSAYFLLWVLTAVWNIAQSCVPCLVSSRKISILGYGLECGCSSIVNKDAFF